MTLIGIAAASALTMVIPPTYASTSKLFVSTSGTENNQVQGNVVAQYRVPSYAQLLDSVQFTRLVIEKLGLTDLTPLELVDNVEVLVADKSVILEITVSDASPQRAQLIANTMASEFVGLVTVLETPDPVTAVDANGVTVTTTQVAPVKVTVAQAGELAYAPVFPDPILLLPLGLLVGLLLGLLLALVRHFMDNTVKSSKQIEELTGATTIGGVLYDAAMAAQPRFTQHQTQSVTTEAYRQIRTNLQYVNVDNPPKIIVVTSSVSGEGKTTTAINLALVLAQSGQRVVLVEADLRRPRVIRYLQLIGGAGLTNILAGKAELSELLQPWGDGKLSVLASGPNPPDPSELLGSEHMSRLLEELRETHDYVIIDAPPLLPVTDAAVLAVLSDGVVLVTRWGVTKREQLRAAATTIKLIEARVLGTVLNMIPPKGGGGYGYGYGYGYSYQSDPNPRELIDASNEGRRARASRGRTTADVNAARSGSTSNGRAPSEPPDGVLYSGSESVRAGRPYK
ncbi:MAG: polysaccharide biosynthesis tyrosine autokinase [Actinomycetota bacterium]|nr:polysaccharide biosynthesis tyrosine autokinase [Actinomycetota bacterium]